MLWASALCACEAVQYNKVDVQYNKVTASVR